MQKEPAVSNAPRATRMLLIVILALTLVVSQGVIVAQGTWQSMLRPTCVSLTNAGTYADDDSWNPSINYNGRYIVFESDANDITADDLDPNGEGEKDVFYHDRVTGHTTLISNSQDATMTTDRGSRDASISDDGRYVAFLTGNSYSNEDTNAGQDIYVWDAVNDTYRWIDFVGDGSALGSGPDRIQISGDGTYLTFDSWDGDLLDTGLTGESANVWGYDLESDEATLVSVPAGFEGTTNRGSRTPAISNDGHYIAFMTGDSWDIDDDNGNQDVYVKNMETGDLKYVDFSNGNAYSPLSEMWDLSMSGDGMWVAGTTYYDLLPDDYMANRDVYAYNLVSDEATLVSGPQDSSRGSRNASLSDVGTIMFYTGQAFDPEDTNNGQDLYVKDLTTGVFTRIPVTGEDPLPGDCIDNTWISGDGSGLVIEKDGCEWLPEDTNGEDDIYYSSTTQVQLSDGDTRLEGTNRYQTAIDVSVQGFPMGARTVVIATGESWPDALGGAALAGAVDGPILLTESDWLTPEVVTELERLNAQNVYLLGGYNAVSPTVETQLEVLLDGYVWRIGGPDRYATSKAVANRTIEVLGTEYDGKACVTTGMNFPDAVGAAPLGAGLGWPVLLVRPDDPIVILPPTTDSVVILGGTSAVGTTAETYLNGLLGDEDVDRMGGADRYETSALVAQYGVDHGLLWNGVGITSGENYPDALAGGAALGLYRTTLLLTPTDSLAPAAADALNANAADIEDVTFLGGGAAVSASVEAHVKAILGL